MGKPLIIVGSVTNAIASRNLLEMHGIPSGMERTPCGGGCGYSIYVPDRTDDAEEILLQNGIRVYGRAERRG